MAIDEPAAFTYRDTLDVTDVKRHIAHPLSVPAGTTRIHVDFQFEPAQVNNVTSSIGVSLYEPGGAFRGFRHGASNHKVVDVGVGGADDGFLPGPLPAGDWTVELNTFMIAPGKPLEYTLRVWTLDEPTRETRPTCLVSVSPVRRDAGWYRGDLHTHTYHSDGHRSVGELLETARQWDLDFVALTDHNNVTQLYHSDLEDVDGLAVVPGMELTTFYGHGLSLGTTTWFDWRIGRSGVTMRDSVDAIHAKDGIAIAAHPLSRGDPYCTGCTWLFPELMPGPLDAVEVWNSTWGNETSQNEQSLQLWYTWLNAGYRIPATAGSDAHTTTSYRDTTGFSIIYAEELSTDALLAGIRRGHVMLSSGPRVWIETQRADGTTVMMGDAVAVDVDSWTIPVSVRWAGAPADTELRLIADGSLQHVQTVTPDGSHTYTPMVHRWIVAELWNTDGTLLAVTNPIYIDR